MLVITYISQKQKWSLQLFHKPTWIQYNWHKLIWSILKFEVWSFTSHIIKILTHNYFIKYIVIRNILKKYIFLRLNYQFSPYNLVDFQFRPCILFKCSIRSIKFWFNWMIHMTWSNLTNHTHHYFIECLICHPLYSLSCFLSSKHNSND